MKKIMFAIAVALIAAVTQAASVQWSSGAVYDPSGTAKVGKGNTDYTVVIAFFTDAAGQNEVSGITGTTSVSTSGTGSKYGGTADGFASSTTYYAQLTVTSKDGASITSEIASFTTPGVGGASLGFADGIGFDTPGAKINTQDPSAWKGGDVPEPTSGLLLLIGGAMLALRRKQK